MEFKFVLDGPKMHDYPPPLQWIWGIYRFTEEKKGGVIMLLCISVNKYTAVNLENNVYHKFSCSGNTYPVGLWA